MYKIALLSVPFDNSYTDNLALSTTQQQLQFKLDEIFNDSPLYNFKIGNALNTTITLRTDKLVPYAYDYNYLITFNIDNNTYLYYFINNITFDTGNQLIFDLELDVIQSYYNKCRFDYCYIERAHIDRFIQKTNGNYCFNNTINSPLYLEEDGNLLKRVERKTTVDINLHGLDKNVEDWLNANIDYWEVYVLEGGDVYDIPVYSGGNAPYTPILNTDITLELGLYVIPHYKNDYRIRYVYNNVNFTPNDRYVTNGILNTARIVSHLVTPICPLRTNHFASVTQAPINGDLVINSATSYLNSLYFLSSDKDPLSNFYSAFLVSNSWESYRDSTETLEILTPSEFDITNLTLQDIRTYSNIEALNPKLYLKNVYSIELTDGFHTREYIPLALSDSKSRKCYATTAFSPDVVSTNLSPVSTTNVFGEGVYDFSTGYDGLNSSQDGQILFSRSQLDTYLANNKNFLAQALTTSASRISSAGVGFGLQGLSSGIIGGVANLANTALQYDNLANAPDNVVGSKTNTLQTLAINSLKIMCRQIRATEYDRIQLNNYTKLYGYRYDSYDYIQSLVDRRNAFTYIKARLTTIRRDAGVEVTNNIPQFVRSKMRDIFANGIRFWRFIDQVGDYTIPNYELYL